MVGTGDAQKVPECQGAKGQAEASMRWLSPQHTVALRHVVVDGPGWWCVSEKSVPGHCSGGRAVV